MRYSILLLAALIGSVTLGAEETPLRLGTTDFSLTQEAIGKLRVEAIARALVDLKLQEIALARASKPDAEKLDLVRAQQLGLRKEIENITIAALEDDERRLSDKYLPEHPRMKAIRAEIEVRKAELKKLG